MPTRVPDPARERLWRKHLARWKTTDLTLREFCDREGVTPTAFVHWRKEIAARDARAAATAGLSFVPVQIVPAPPAGHVFEVVLLAGRVVRVPPGFDPAHLRAVVAALEGVPC